MPPHIGRLRSAQDVTKVEATPSGVDQRVNPPHIQSGVYDGYASQSDLPSQDFSIDYSMRIM